MKEVKLPKGRGIIRNIICMGCNKKFLSRSSKRKYCSKSCFAKSRRGVSINLGVNNGMWKGISADNSSKRERTRRMHGKASKCVKCGTTKKKIELHHKDGNPDNNIKSNIMPLCRKCHLTIDGRLKNICEYSTARKGMKMGKRIITCSGSPVTLKIKE